MGDDSHRDAPARPELDLLRIEEGIQVCPTCGFENPLGYYGCQRCGRTLPFHLGPDAHPVPVPRPRPRSTTTVGLLDRSPWLHRLVAWSPLVVVALLIAVLLIG